VNASVGFVSPGNPLDPDSFSGVPYSLLNALAEAGVEARPLRADLGYELRRRLTTILAIPRARSLRELAHPQELRSRERANVDNGRTMIALRTLRMRDSLRRRSVDGAIQQGTAFFLPAEVPVVTFQDTTWLQARRSYPWPHLNLREPTFTRMVTRERSCLERARACCMETHWAARSVIEDYGRPPERVQVVGVGANLRPRSQPGRDWSRPRFLFVGHDWRRKNGERTVRAFAAVRDRLPAAELHVVGRHPRIDVPGVIEHGLLSLRIPEDRARLEMLFEQATCCVVPSLHEPAGIVHAEAAWAGIASIGTTNGGAATIIGDGGTVVDPRSPDAIAAAMIRLGDPRVAASLGARALERSKLFTWRAVAERLLRALALPHVDSSGLADFL
jgi:glycosyltransferase involved in cell wall biosynthesis